MVILEYRGFHMNDVILLRLAEYRKILFKLYLLIMVDLISKVRYKNGLCSKLRNIYLSAINHRAKPIGTNGNESLSLKVLISGLI